MRVARMGCRLVLQALTALALVVAPFHLSIDGPVVAKAYAGKGGNGNGGNGNGGGNNGGGNSGGGNNGNGNSGGNSSGNSNSGGNSGNSKGAANSASNSAASSTADVDDHVNAATGDKVEVSSNGIQVTHRNGMKETIENGRFRMEDKFGRTIVERKATTTDLNRLKSL
ncbi:MAG: hypothetical protein E5X80_26465 [Mesorhizobium sp.]|uniref:hypothetical protein n=1 Tax=Mesorhizobium sp. TaxID=1871066 RepID=UPI0011F964EF|nr:hypothetical protein [Mesorhizobium sp.]TIO51839.1 MAG: hypothetical protein E5X78_14870 [Mesorhizobium sp.]TIO58064.1 MAG: hypothetical protein E5X79_23105 [Mesorhizobium sp.]TJV59064.1 MAG: hypothetical protein E5X80_26465 [Mesorhizobium sp.]